MKTQENINILQKELKELKEILKDATDNIERATIQDIIFTKQYLIQQQKRAMQCKK